MREFGSDPVQPFPGHGQMKPKQQEIARLRCEVTKLRGRAGYPKKRPQPSLRRKRHEVRLRREAPAIWPVPGYAMRRGVRGRASMPG
nr:transposase and inactivated derivatives [Bradyrhizobium sp. DOA9]